MLGHEVTGDWADVDGAFGREMDRIEPAPSVRFGLEMAVWNLYASHVGKGLPGLVTPSPRTEVPVNGLIPGPPASVLDEARCMRHEGYRSIKLKVGGRIVAEDVGLVRGLTEELGDGISLRLDANRAWGYEEAAEFIHGVTDIPFEYLEEPLADPAKLPELVHEFGVPVALDESLGGISRTLRMAGRALHLGMTPVLSSAYESGVGTAALVALAAGIGEHPVPAGLDTYRALAEDVLDAPLALPAPRVDVGQAIYASRRVALGRLERL